MVATLVGVTFAWRDSLEYWTETVRNTDRIGTATLNTNQNIAGALARLASVRAHVSCCGRSPASGAAVTVWAARRTLKADQPVLALICVAMFGLVVSPVSWSHHWVWVLPTVLVTAVVAYRQRQAALALVSAAGIVLMVSGTPIPLMPEHHETAASLWRQLLGGSYVWWAIAVIIVAGTVSVRPAQRSDKALDEARVPAVN